MALRVALRVGAPARILRGATLRNRFASNDANRIPNVAEGSMQPLFVIAIGQKQPVARGSCLAPRSGIGWTKRKRAVTMLGGV